MIRALGMETKHGDRDTLKNMENTKHRKKENIKKSNDK